MKINATIEDAIKLTQDYKGLFYCATQHGEEISISVLPEKKREAVKILKRLGYIKGYLFTDGDALTMEQAQDVINKYPDVFYMCNHIADIVFIQYKYGKKEEGCKILRGIFGAKNPKDNSRNVVAYRDYPAITVYNTTNCTV